MQDGRLVYSPIVHSHPLSVLGLPGDWPFWAEHNRAMLAACQPLVVLTLPGWEQSKGIAAEVALAAELEIPVEYEDPRGGGPWVSAAPPRRRPGSSSSAAPGARRPGPTSPAQGHAAPGARVALQGREGGLPRRSSAQLHAEGMVTRLDENALARYADLFVQYRQASEFIAKFGAITPCPAARAGRRAGAVDASAPPARPPGPCAARRPDPPRAGSSA